MGGPGSSSIPSTGGLHSGVADPKIGALSGVSGFLGLTLSHFVSRAAWCFFGASAFVYVLFQKKLLPKPACAFVSKLFFIPTFPITVLMRLGNYWTPVDDTLILGCAPVGFLGHPKELFKQNVRGVVNMCYEYSGPKDYYGQLGIKQLR
jgi:hypothetical protein